MKWITERTKLFASTINTTNVSQSFGTSVKTFNILYMELYSASDKSQSICSRIIPNVDITPTYYYIYGAVNDVWNGVALVKIASNFLSISSNTVEIHGWTSLYLEIYGQ